MKKRSLKNALLSAGTALFAISISLQAQYPKPGGGSSSSSGGAPSGSAGGDLGGTFPNPTVNKINGVSWGADCVVMVTNSTGVPKCIGSVDGSNNVLLPGGLQTGTGSGVGGYHSFIQGTDPSAAFPASSWTFYAGTSQTKVGMKLPSSDSAGAFVSDGSGTMSIKGFSGTGNICLASGSSCGGGGSSGSLVLIEQHTSSSSSTLDFTTCISSTYDDYLIEFQSVNPATDGANLRWRVSTDGSTYDTGNNYRYNNIVGGGGVSIDGNNPISEVSLTYTGTGQDNSINLGVTGALRLVGPGSSAYKRIIGQLSYLGNDNSLHNYFVNGAYISATAVVKFRFLYSSGSFADGSIIRCYGIAKS